VRADFHQAKCSGSRVINSALDFGQLQTSIANICKKGQATDKRKTALLTTIFFYVRLKQLGELWCTNKNDLDL